jgi:hypothetical protein
MTPSAGGLALQSWITPTRWPVVAYFVEHFKLKASQNEQLIQPAPGVPPVSYVARNLRELKLRPTTTYWETCPGVGYIHILNLVAYSWRIRQSAPW